MTLCNTANSLLIIQNCQCKHFSYKVFSNDSKDLWSLDYDSVATLICFISDLYAVPHFLWCFTGLAMLAAAHPDDEERGTAIGIAMGTTALGVLGNKN